MSESPELLNESYVLYNHVMNPLTAQQERKTRKDHGTRRGRHSVSSSSTFNQLSSSRLNDDDDGNDEGTSRTSTPSPTRFVNSLTNEIPQVFQNPPNIDPGMEPFYTHQTKIINRQVQIRYEHRGRLRSIEKGLRNLWRNMKKYTIVNAHGLVYHDLYLGGKALVERKNVGFDLTKSDLCPSFIEYHTAKGVGLRVADSHIGNHREDDFTPLETIQRFLGITGSRSLSSSKGRPLIRRGGHAFSQKEELSEFLAIYPVLSEYKVLLPKCNQTIFDALDGLNLFGCVKLTTFDVMCKAYGCEPLVDLFRGFVGIKSFLMLFGISAAGIKVNAAAYNC
ncbi:hypothetical protein Tco_1229308 [Tanacetum coccineum]